MSAPAIDTRPRGGWQVPAAVVICAMVAGHVLAGLAAPTLQGRMLPWVLGRGFGLAGYLLLTVLVGTGLWFRHPWSRASRWLTPAARLRVHAVLAAGAGVVIAGHVVSLALDRYAGVGWTGAWVPGRSGYRPLGVALGTIAVYLGLLVGGTAALAGRVLVRHRWMPVHRLAVACFALVWIHGVLAGSDTGALRGVYVATGVLVVTLAVTRRHARGVEPELESAR